MYLYFRGFNCIEMLIQNFNYKELIMYKKLSCLFFSFSLFLFFANTALAQEITCQISPPANSSADPSCSARHNGITILHQNHSWTVSNTSHASVTPEFSGFSERTTVRCLCRTARQVSLDVAFNIIPLTATDSSTVDIFCPANSSNVPTFSL